MDLKAARGSFFGAYLEGTCRKIAEARRREALILAKGLILNTFLDFGSLVSRPNRAIAFKTNRQQDYEPRTYSVLMAVV